MKTRRIGGVETSCIGIGAMSFSDFYGPVSEAQAFAVLDAAMEAGVTHIDTSNIYGMGRSESAIGAWLKANPGVRDGLHIATKASITSDLEGRRYFDNSPEHLESELDGSLRRLGVDHVDLFYIHRREQERPIEEVAETMARLVKKGKIRAVGFSEIAPSSLRRAHAVHPVAAVQSEYSLSSRFVELGLLQACEELGTALVAFSPVGRSLLTDHPLSGEEIATNRFLSTNPRFVEPNLSANLDLTDRFRALAADMGVPAAGLSIAWLLAKGEAVLPIPGTRSVSHFAELVAGASLELTSEDMARIETVLPVGWCHGDRYSAAQYVGPERFC